MSKETNPPTTTDDERLDENFYDEEFDGYRADGTRCAPAVASAPVADFGLPADPDDIGPRNSDEFEADAQEISRGITALDMGAPNSLSTSFDPASEEFDAGHGASFMASGHLFAAGPYQGAVKTTVTAPPLPSYLRLAPTSFRTSAPLPKLLSALTAAFAATSVSAAPLEGCACAYECSAHELLSVVDFEVRVFACGPTEHAVEARRLDGCRYAFGGVASKLLRLAGCPAGQEVPKRAAFQPPTLSDEALLELPSLTRATTGPAIPPKPAGVGAGAPSDLNPPSPPEPLPLEAPADLAATCAHVKSLLDPKKCSVAVLVQGARAAGALAASQANAMGTCSHRGACGADHRGHHLLFAEGGAWLGLADRVAQLSHAPAPAGSCEAEAAHWAELRSVAMAAVANVAALEHVCRGWLDKAVRVVAEGIKEEGNNEDRPHHKREALRAAEAMAKRDKELAAKLVRAGVVPALEYEADGGEGGLAQDDAAQRYALGALEACRS